jgi:hypothetical protein
VPRGYERERFALHCAVASSNEARLFSKMRQLGRSDALSMEELARPESKCEVLDNSTGRRPGSRRASILLGNLCTNESRKCLKARTELARM